MQWSKLCDQFKGNAHFRKLVEQAIGVDNGTFVAAQELTVKEDLQLCLETRDAIEIYTEDAVKEGMPDRKNQST